MMTGSTGNVTVPPGFRFHPTDEELLHYYLRKKVAYEAIDIDVIRDIDLNKLEPWDLKDKCRIGSGPQNEWYFFSHKDKKYPTGTRTNRATTAGFWKATGRDKAIHFSNSKRIGMRKTLVFYTGRAPHGQKTDWIMHEYRLDDDTSEVQEDGWVVCRVFKKKNQQRRPEQDVGFQDGQYNHLKAELPAAFVDHQKHNFQMQHDFNLDTSMHLPHLMSPEAALTPFLPSISLNHVDIECSQNLMKLGAISGMVQQERFHGDWSILDKLLASHQSLDQLYQPKGNSSTAQGLDVGLSLQRFPFQYMGCESDIFKYSK